MTVERHQPDLLFPSERLGFTQVVTASARTLVWVAGQTACDVRGRPVGGTDVVVQAGVALENLRVALSAAGATPADVTMMRVYVVGLTRDVADAIAPKVARFLDGAPPPASTWLGVKALFHPDFLVEIEAMAALP